ncbi:hypothetical protein A936_00792 [Enterobacter sp. Ag1]|nr:hypothetical protein A936_00792 [Enterobacter sp. Ag1]
MAFINVIFIFIFRPSAFAGFIRFPDLYSGDFLIFNYQYLIFLLMFVGFPEWFKREVNLKRLLFLP